MKLRKITSALMLLATASLFATEIVFLTTNDTHSQIDPEESGVGGVLRRKVLIDSIRQARGPENVILVDAGDAVQGTLYFTLYNGDVEFQLMNLLGYDVQTLGNHDFDNGIEETARMWKLANAEKLSANYDFSETPCAGLFKPYTIKEIAGKKIGFIGLNVDPANLIMAENYPGMKFLDPLTVGDSLSRVLKHDLGCDLVVAVTHLGYTRENDKAIDSDLVAATSDIDIIIGGHSHTTLPEPVLLPNKNGRLVLVTQTGKAGRNLGQIVVDMDRLADGATAYKYSLLPVNQRITEDRYDPAVVEFLTPFRHSVDSVNGRVIAESLQAMAGDKRVGAYPNWIADFALAYGKHKRDSLGISSEMPIIGVMNVGGIRHDMPQGEVTEGGIRSTFPFANKMIIEKVKGRDIIDDMIMAAGKGGEAISSNVRVILGHDEKVKDVIINGQPIEEDKDYLVSTITYIGEGNDNFEGMSRGEWLWTDNDDMIVPILGYINQLTSMGLPLMSDPNSRFVTRSSAAACCGHCE